MSTYAVALHVECPLDTDPQTWDWSALLHEPGDPAPVPVRTILAYPIDAGDEVYHFVVLHVAPATLGDVVWDEDPGDWDWNTLVRRNHPSREAVRVEMLYSGKLIP